MDSKKFIDLLSDEKIREEIINLYCKLDLERFTEGSHMGSGWGWTIILDEDGDVDYMYASNNNMRMDVYNGSAIEVAFLSDNAEVSTDSMGDIENVEDYKDFIKHLEEEFETYALEKNLEDEDYEEEKQEYINDNATWMNYYDFNQEGYKKIEIEAWEAICDAYSYDQIIDCIYDKSEMLRCELEQYEYFEKAQDE